MTADKICFVYALTKAMAKVLSGDIGLVVAVSDVLFSRRGCFWCLLSHRWRDASDAKTKTKDCEVLVQCFLQWIKPS